ncbi:hypothetical protein SAMD00019534_038720 [Acytostelium subglobosum LB1]|uniref:hypothetical protein n=1 Tax=Acytostelium subglobosum LB1 TaxID=1410327 RepID=UPI000645041B|nr:hypothetical protein SAMD00019534_038720 [Acytostelium subglobosum LB1]GAM20697.1 hypothetical protein SAMD00019534_038720 [Acytostelium subglobosum LB1]|eukprot:XP_012760218.1 hypothetical protein SAMD00019534_038720 [Acytostelium subglobosum LB1]
MTLTFSVVATDGDARLSTLKSEQQQHDPTIAPVSRSIDTPTFMFYTKQGSVDNITKDLLNSLPHQRVHTLQMLYSDLVQFIDVLDKYQKGVHQFLSVNEHMVFVSLRDSASYQETTFNEQGFSILARKGNKKMGNAEYYNSLKIIKPDMVSSLCFDIPWDSSTKKLKKQLALCSSSVDTVLKDTSFDNSTVIAAVVGSKAENSAMEVNKVTATKDVGGFILSNFGTNESLKEREDQIPKLLALLPASKPRLITGLGSPEEVVYLIEQGIDIINTSYPFSITEWGHALTFEYKYDRIKQQQQATSLNKINLWDAKHVVDTTPIVAGCQCFTCINHTKAYIHHLLNTHEMLSQVLLTIHNISHYLAFFAEIRSVIKQGQFKEYKTLFLAQRSKERDNE